MPALPKKGDDALPPPPISAIIFQAGCFCSTEQNHVAVEAFTAGVFIAIGGIVAAGRLHAVTLVGATSDATGIDGLVVDSVTYNFI